MATSRRKFIHQLGGSVVMLTAGSLHSFAAQEEQEKRTLQSEKKITANDTIRVGVIGMGIMGFRDTQTLLKVPGVELVACCDLYTGRLQRARELYGGQLFITKDYREILNRKDIDAVIVCTGDHWHQRITIDAMRKGKAVYCEKPVVHHLSEGHELIKVQKETNAILQVGSQRVSSIAYAKAKELYKAGEIGQLNSVEASFDRQSALGAWKYTIPPDASLQTVDWDRYQENVAKHPFDEKRFFWWRNYREYGTGVAGDLFVHLLSGLHFLTDSKGPSKIFSIGDLCYWKDGRDVPDVMSAVLKYPETKEHQAFQVTLRVNLVSGQGDKAVTKFVGTEGVIDFGWNDFTIRRSKMSKAPGYGGWDSFDTYPAAMQKQLATHYNQEYSTTDQQVPKLSDLKYATPAGYSDSYDHFINFFESVRTKKPVVEDVEFGFRAAAPCLACNESYFQQKVIYWDAEKMLLKSTE